MLQMLTCQGIMTILRDETTKRSDFIFYTDRLATLICEYALSFLPHGSKDIVTATGIPFHGVANCDEVSVEIVALSLGQHDGKVPRTRQLNGHISVPRDADVWKRGTICPHRAVFNPVGMLMIPRPWSASQSCAPADHSRTASAASSAMCPSVASLSSPTPRRASHSSSARHSHTPSRATRLRRTPRSCSSTPKWAQAQLLVSWLRNCGNPEQDMWTIGQFAVQPQALCWPR